MHTSSVRPEDQVPAWATAEILNALVDKYEAAQHPVQPAQVQSNDPLLHPENIEAYLNALRGINQ